MIELRWARKYVPTTYYENGHWATAREEKILQCRSAPDAEWIEVPDSGVYIHPPQLPQRGEQP